MTEALMQQIQQRMQKNGPFVLAIDGPCAGGKTTLAAALAQVCDCNVLHMDDFFLQPHQRTPERLSQPGGNVDYERFYEEVLLPLTAGKPFSFRPFDCSTQCLQPSVMVTPKKLTVIEGTYSHHPFFGQVYDLRVFLGVSPRLQRERILARPAFLHRRFFGEWIPMEEAYFSAFAIRENSDLLLESTCPADRK